MHVIQIKDFLIKILSKKTCSWFPGRRLRGLFPIIASRKKLCKQRSLHYNVRQKENTNMIFTYLHTWATPWGSPCTYIKFCNWCLCCPIPYHQLRRCTPCQRTKEVTPRCRHYTQSQFRLFFVLLGFIYNIYTRFKKCCKLKKYMEYMYIYASPFLIKVSVLDEKTNDIHISWMSSNCNVLENRCMYICTQLYIYIYIYIYTYIYIQKIDASSSLTYVYLALLLQH